MFVRKLGISGAEANTLVLYEKGTDRKYQYLASSKSPNGFKWIAYDASSDNLRKLDFWKAKTGNNTVSDVKVWEPCGVRRSPPSNPSSGSVRSRGRSETIGM